MIPTTPLLDTPIAHILADEVHLDRVLKAIEAHTEMTYLDAFQRVAGAASDAAQRVLAPGEPRVTTLSALLADLPLDEIAHDVRVLERRDIAGQKFMLDAQLPLQAAVNERGFVPFTAEHADEVGRIMTGDPATQVGRFFRARTAGYNGGPQEVFNSEDEAHTANGHDMVATLEVHARASKTAATRLAALDEKLGAAPDPASHLRVLDAEPASYPASAPGDPIADRFLRRARLYQLESGVSEVDAALHILANMELLEEEPEPNEPAVSARDPLAEAGAKAEKMMLDNDAPPSAYPEYLKAAVEGREIAS